MRLKEKRIPQESYQIVQNNDCRAPLTLPSPHLHDPASMMLGTLTHAKVRIGEESTDETSFLKHLRATIRPCGTPVSPHTDRSAGQRTAIGMWSYNCATITALGRKGALFAVLRPIGSSPG
jgi:hypothetical protein